MVLALVPDVDMTIERNIALVGELGLQRVHRHVSFRPHGYKHLLLEAVEQCQQDQFMVSEEDEPVQIGAGDFKVSSQSS